MGLGDNLPAVMASIAKFDGDERAFWNKQVQDAKVREYPSPDSNNARQVGSHAFQVNLVNAPSRPCNSAGGLDLWPLLIYLMQTAMSCCLPR